MSNSTKKENSKTKEGKKKILQIFKRLTDREGLSSEGKSLKSGIFLHTMKLNLKEVKYPA